MTPQWPIVDVSVTLMHPAHLVLVPFIISAPKIWNSLPPHILQSQTLDSFRRHLKTYYFQSAYPAP